MSAKVEAEVVNAKWEDVTPDDPCPVCHRCEGCEVRGHETACVNIHNGQGKRKDANGTDCTIYDMRTFRHVPPVEQAVELIHRYFLNRTDVVAHIAGWNEPCPCFGGDQLAPLLDCHLAGRKGMRVRWCSEKKPEGELSRKTSRYWRVGSYGPALDGTTRWLVIDFDGGGEHSAPLADPGSVAMSLRKLCQALGIAAHLEKSKSCKGWHLWVFFDPPISAKIARQFGYAILPHDAVLTDGQYADPHKSMGLEVFPKCNDLSGSRTVGAQMWLPWYCQAEPGGNLFYLPFEGRGLLPYIPDGFRTHTEAIIRRALEAVQALHDAEDATR
jgi:hypothetical protein